MLHPRLTAVGSTLPVWLGTIGPYGAWSDLSYMTRWGAGACGMYEASFTMALPSDFSDPVLRRGTLVELMDGPYRVGSPLIMAEPAVGSGLGDPWTITCTGIGREVEGENSFYASDASGNASTVQTTIVDQAIVEGWRIAGRNSSVPATSPSTLTVSENLNTVGAVLNAGSLVAGKRWGVKNDNVLYYMADPTTPAYHVTPDAAALGVADDDYSSMVKVRYLDSTTGTYLTRTATNAQTAARFGSRQFLQDVTNRFAMSSSAAQNIADQILALTKGRLGWTNGFTLTSNQLLTSGGVPASLSIAAEDVGNGCMVRLHGIYNDLLEYNGQTWLDLVIGQAKLTDGAQTIQMDPMGLAPRDLAAVIESVAGVAA